MNDTICELHDLEERRRLAMIAGDVPALELMLSEQLAYTHSNAAVDTKAEYLAKLDSGYFNYRTLAFSDQQIGIIGDTALVTGRMTGEVTIDSVERKLNSRTTVVWVRDNGRWQLLAFASTPFPAV